jgi:hypothetical protein
MKKIKEYTQEQRDMAEFACRVCRAMYKDRTGVKGDCSCRPIGYYCPYIEEILEKETEK